MAVRVVCTSKAGPSSLGHAVGALRLAEPVAGGDDAAESSALDAGPQQRPSHPRHVGGRHVRARSASTTMHPGRLVEPTPAGGAPRPRASRRPGKPARCRPSCDGVPERAGEAPDQRVGRLGLRRPPADDGEPEAGARGQVEPGLRVAGSAQGGATAASDASSSQVPSSRCRVASQSSARAADGRPARPGRRARPGGSRWRRPRPTSPPHCGRPAAVGRLAGLDVGEDLLGRRGPGAQVGQPGPVHRRRRGRRRSRSRHRCRPCPVGYRRRSACDAPGHPIAGANG